KRTKKEVSEREATLAEETKAQAEEDAAERQAAKEVESIPTQDGVYYVHGEKLDTMKIAESKIVNNKRRSVLKAISPLPLVTGKQTLELDGDSAAMRVAEKRPEFYFRLSAEERFAIIKLSPTKKGARIVEHLDLIPVTKDVVETREEIA